MEKEVVVSFSGKVNPEVKRFIEQTAKAAIQPFVEETEKLREENKRLREAQRWVSIGERLPEEGQTVICAKEDAVFPACKWYGPDFGWQSKNARYSKGFFTHWMPLPNAPVSEVKP
jgi:hypothetical protein